MADTLTTFTNLINSPPGQLVAGGVLAGIVWKVFDKVQAVLTEHTKFEIAVWLVGVKVEQKVMPWPETFAKVFDRVFGRKHLSVNCFIRSSIASTIALGAMVGAYLLFGPSLTGPIYTGAIQGPTVHIIGYFFLLTIPMNYVGDYISLLETRLLIFWMTRISSAPIRLLLLLLDVVVGSAVFFFGFWVAQVIAVHWSPRWSMGNLRDVYMHLGFVNVSLGEDFTYFYTFSGFPSVFLYASLLTSIWLWLYAGSGFLLKFARRFDIGFDWFNRKFDIEKKPLSAIGLVAGALVAVVYWGFAVGTYLMKK
jgi:hypothetical protein